MMSRSDRNNEESGEMNRRRFLSVIGSGIATTGVASGAGSDTSTENNENDVIPPRFNILSDKKSGDLIKKAIESEEYLTLQNNSALIERKKVDPNKADVYRFEWNKDNHGEDRIRYLVEISPEQNRQHDDKKVIEHSIDIVIEDGAVEKAQVTKIEETYGGFLEISTAGAATSVPSNSVTPSASTGISIREESGRYNPYRNELLDSSSMVQPASHGCGCTLKCSLCVQIYKFACEYGCPLGFSGVCAAANIGGIPGSLSCTAVAKAACDVVKAKSGLSCNSVEAQKFCNNKFDICDEVL